MSSPFDGIEKAQPKAERLPTLTEGTYLLETIMNKVLITQSGSAILREFKIVEATGPDALPAGVEAKAKLLYLQDQFVKSRIAEHVRGLTNSDKIDASLCDVIYGEKNPMAGKLVKVAVEKAVSDKEKSYLKYTWRYVDQPEFAPKGEKKK